MLSSYKEIFFPGCGNSVIFRDVSMFKEENIIEDELEIYFSKGFNEFSTDEKRNIINENITIPLNNLYNSYDINDNDNDNDNDNYILIRFKMFIGDLEIPCYLFKSNDKDLLDCEFHIHNLKYETLYNELLLF